MRMLPGTRALRTFEAAGRHLNFTKAAAEIGLSPAAVSYQIKEIEEQLGIILFTRTSRAIQLTPAGMVIFEAAADALSNLRKAVSQARGMTQGKSGLRISLGAMFATNWLFPKLPAFYAEFPELQLSFDVSDEVRDFELDEIDIAIRFGNGNYKNMQADRLFGTSVIPICSPLLLDGSHKIVTPDDFRSYTLCHVDCKLEGHIWPTWDTWMKAAGISDFDPSGCIVFNDATHVVQTVLSSEAIGLVELPLVANEIAKGNLVKLFNINVALPENYGYYLVYPQETANDPGVVTFRKWLFDRVNSE